MLLSSTLLLACAGVAAAVDLSDLPTFLNQTSNAVFPALKNISVEIWNDPELGLDETHAHDLIVDYFSKVPGWKVTPNAYGLPTAFTVSFENRPANFTGDLPVVGFMAEYDALPGIGHACGHNLIALNGITAASLTAAALVNYDIPGQVILQGCPDEENAAGKFTLNNAGAFDAADVWLMAHPSSASAIQPMNARLNFFARFPGTTHQEAVFNAYEGLAIVSGLGGKLPGLDPMAVVIEDVGVYATNVVQSFIGFGVSGSTLETVNQTVASILDSGLSSYPNVAYTVFNDADGVAINMTGPGGHASDSTNGPLILSINTFLALKNTSGVSFYLPGNTSYTELDITVDMRARYTSALPQVATAVAEALGNLTNAPSSLTHDVRYPALEVTPYLPDLFLDLVNTSAYGLNDWSMSDFAPASTDASWVQDPVLDPNTYELISAAKAILHANYNICGPLPTDPCAFNHDPEFRVVAGTDFAYAQTEIVARAESQIAVQLLADPAEMAQATAIIKVSNSTSAAAN